MILWSAVGCIILINQSLTSVRYLSIVADQVHPFMTAMSLSAYSIYQCSYHYKRRQHTVYCLVIATEAIEEVVTDDGYIY